MIELPIPRFTRGLLDGVKGIIARKMRTELTKDMPLGSDAGFIEAIP